MFFFSLWNLQNQSLTMTIGIFCTSKSLLGFEQKDGTTFSAPSVSEWVLIKLPSGRRLQYYLKADKRNESGFLSTLKNGTKQQQNDEVCRSI